MKRIRICALIAFCLWSTTGVGVATATIDDWLRQLQSHASSTGKSDWGYWGDQPAKYSSWTYHSNRLVPIYTFGISLDRFIGENSLYRDADQLTRIYGRLPDATLNAEATYMDQTDVYRLQKAAAAAGKKHIFLIVFDGMEWQTTRAAAIYKNQRVDYHSGYGSGLAFLDYDQCAVRSQADLVCSPHNTGTKADVNSQSVVNIGGDKHGGYSAQFGGKHSWSKASSDSYLLGKRRDLPHVVTDSAASATSMNSGIKTYNSAINVDPSGGRVSTIARDLQADGFRIGIVTSVPISHATPACAYANNVSRNDYQDLTRDLLGLPSVANRQSLPGVDVLIGCGWGEDRADDRKKQGENYEPGNKYLAESDVETVDVANGGQYVIAQRIQGKRGGEVLARAAKTARENQQRLLGFFGVKGGHLPYQTADGRFDPTNGGRPAERYTEGDLLENPTLAQMTEAALQVLEESEKGFWLMIEAGDVDWANHNNNIDDSIGAVFSGEKAFETVTHWIEENSNWSESAVIVTADHGHYFVLTDPERLIGRPAKMEVDGDDAVGNR